MVDADLHLLNWDYTQIGDKRRSEQFVESRKCSTEGHVDDDDDD